VRRYFSELGFVFQQDSDLLRGCVSTRAWSPARNLEVHLVSSSGVLVFANVALHNDPKRWTDAEQKMGIALISKFLNLVDLDSISAEQELQRLLSTVEGFGPIAGMSSERNTARAKIFVRMDVNPAVLNVTIQSLDW
jgi:hypothetical protein